MTYRFPQNPSCGVRSLCFAQPKQAVISHRGFGLRDHGNPDLRIAELRSTRAVLYAHFSTPIAPPKVQEHAELPSLVG